MVYLRNKAELLDSTTLKFFLSFFYFFFDAFLFESKIFVSEISIVLMIYNLVS